MLKLHVEGTKVYIKIDNHDEKDMNDDQDKT
jgi:hypothetical protein